MLGTARTLALATMLSLAAIAGTATAQETRTISLIGTGEVSVIPDIATVHVGVETQAETATGALAENSVSAARVIAALKQAGVDAADIRTANFSVQPVYSDRKSLSSGGPAIAGYRISNQVIARVRNLDGLGALLDRVIGEGANRVNAISFGLSDDTEAAERARTLAVQDALARALTYAEATGVSLGPVLSITEADPGIPVPSGIAMMRAESVAVPIESGTATVSARVAITWKIGE